MKKEEIDSGLKCMLENETDAEIISMEQYIQRIYKASEYQGYAWTRSWCLLKNARKQNVVLEYNGFVVIKSQQYL